MNPTAASPPVNHAVLDDLKEALSPFDEHNRLLRSRARPPEWTNPTPTGPYNLVVIGAGTAGLVAAAGAAGLGAKVALIERGLMGGDCLNFGCVPSKALIRCARAMADVRRAAEFGIAVPGNPGVDFAAVMARMRRLRAQLSSHDSAQRFLELGVDVYLGEAIFTGRDSVDVNGQALRFSKALIATGSRAAIPPIEGIQETGYLTNETAFSLTELPPRLAVIGAGPIGCELAQAFARFGSRVTLIEIAPRILPKDDPDAARVVSASMDREGVAIVCGGEVKSIRREGDECVLHLDRSGTAQIVRADRILVGVGRAPNVASLNLDAAGVECVAKDGVIVNDYLQTTNPRIYAAGDVASPYKFTHAADAMARIVLRNALFFGREKASKLTIPWCTYTDPEVAHVGLNQQEIDRRGLPVQTIEVPMRGVDRAVLDGDEEGFLRVYLRKGSDRIVGATLVARHAGDLISEFTAAMTSRVGLCALAQTIYPYPTQAEVIKKAADAYNRRRLTPAVKRAFAALLAWRR